jgi:hypothetical protein
VRRASDGSGDLEAAAWPVVEKVAPAFQAHLLAAQRLERQLHETGPTAAK